MWETRAASFPRLYAAASLKPVEHRFHFLHVGCFPRLYAAASLKPRNLSSGDTTVQAAFSAALCRGLIEADTIKTRISIGNGFSAALCRGLIEARAVG